MSSPSAGSSLDPRWTPILDDPSQSSSLASGWPLLLTLMAYPVIWLLGVRLIIWPLAALLLLVALARRRDRALVAPAGFALWLGFLGWTLVSALVLAAPDRLFAWGYRESLYLSATVVLIFCLNATETQMPRHRIAAALSVLFGASVVMGTLGILVPVDLTTPMQLLLPASIEKIPFIAQQVQAQLGTKAVFLGAVRPSAPYGYTNEWGAAMGVLWPLAIWASYYLRTRRQQFAARGLLLFSIVPIIISVNRGLWVSIIVATVVVIGRAALSGRVLTAVYALSAAAVAAVVIRFSPLWDVIQQRLDRANLGTRETLAGSALDLAKQSPLFGYGAPQSSADIADTNHVSVGTHGQFYTLLVSHGVPGVGLYIAFFLLMLFLTRNVSGPAIWAWAAIVVTVAQLAFYNALPLPLVLAMIAIAMCVQDTAASRKRATSLASSPLWSN